MKKLLAVLLLAVYLPAAPQKKPKLVVSIAVDQFRYDYLTRFRSEYHGGLDRLLNQGVVFTNAYYEHYPTITAVGHSTMLTGATPSVSGIVGNDWYDRQEKKIVTNVSDPNTKLLGGGAGDTRTGSSPHRLLVDTVGDEMKIASGGKAHVIGISLKDRAAILPSGHMADGAFWFDSTSGSFVSSTYYFADLPGWVKDFNSSRPADQYRGVKWLDHTMTQDMKRLYSEVDSSPFGNELIERLAERALQAEQLGRHDTTDLLAVSFSSNDYVGHARGPDSPEAHEMCLRTDQLLTKFFAAVEQAVGAGNVLFVFMADHGVAPVPEVNIARKMPGGRIEATTVAQAVQAALVKKYGAGEWITSSAEIGLYLNLELIAGKNLDRAEVSRTAAAAALEVPHVYRTFTREDLMHGAVQDDQMGRRVSNGFFAPRSADVELLLDPYWLASRTGTGHGSAFNYDAHVPVIFMGAGIHPRQVDSRIMVNDVAPTLATFLSVEVPSGSVGHPLVEVLQ
jgi:hypothetical protein